ncbi:hypothetical protein [Sphingobium fluviale]|uniref:Transposase n=1 Tax=Sphingobium fluviale TaxID=2506423 RepID=A0A4Q1KDY3_9SPHN|nr:hypothetical protein [Sphingobium fluviale]RXR25181.1 hypothetical protein EQG66_14620 [Sphingobium fluviale]
MLAGCHDYGAGEIPSPLVGFGEDELLNVIEAAWRVLKTLRPRYSCRACDKIVQVPALPKPIARGKLSFPALAHIVMAKWGYHLPICRQERKRILSPTFY